MSTAAEVEQAAEKLYMNWVHSHAGPVEYIPFGSLNPAAKQGWRDKVGPIYPSRPTSNFIPADEMTDAQLRDHLEKAHGFEEYVEEGKTYFGVDTARQHLDTFHEEDHMSDTPYGGSYLCPHVHGKVTV